MTTCGAKCTAEEDDESGAVTTQGKGWRIIGILQLSDRMTELSQLRLIWGDCRCARLVHWVPAHTDGGHARHGLQVCLL
jgi:hypothetical protein